MPFILEPANLGKNDVKKVGGKGANLSELINAGFPVPDAFFVSVEAYDKFVEQNELDKKINDLQACNWTTVMSINLSAKGALFNVPHVDTLCSPFET